MRPEIEIPKGGDGAKVFTNQGGKITVSQPGYGEDILMILTTDEARLVASALKEVADFIDLENQKGEL